MTYPSYIISARPSRPNRLEDLFAFGENSIASMLANPGSFRYAGWTLETLDQPRIVGGEYLEVMNGPRKVIRLYEDGTLLFKADAGPAFLGWGRDEDDYAKKPRLHSLAAIEVTTSFVHFYARLLPYFDQPVTDINFHLQIIDAKVGENYLY